MGNIMKFGLDRLGQRRFELKMDCPNCVSARIIFSAGNGRGHPTVLNENGTGSLSTGDQLLQSKGSIL
jgi:hypothetical protein